ncbi:MAG TPA: acyltransferase family protein [Acidimicrobiales bacterium]|nr:acyltransferase family protein [Acidimicrobiales bacterium]
MPDGVTGRKGLPDPDTSARDGRFLASGDESGTAPGDRPFRPDVEGLRAVAVLLVVLFHAGVSALSGGYIGVDVFFVISGFVITGVLLRERASSGRTSILAFYGRRCRRIIPAASLVIVATVAMAYIFLGNVTGGLTATDGRWASVFLANFHFTAIGTDYLASQRPPSPLQNFWSLSVEEQFYVVYPTLFLLLAGIRTRLSLRARLAMGLVIVIGVSLTFSILDTASHPTGAYFSPFTRAWELALGALVAVGTPWLLKIPEHLAAVASWLGLGAILGAAFVFSTQTAYPGSLVSIPVAGSALIIAAGVRAPRLGVESLLRLAPLRGLGKLSYSLYLWHWPILLVAAEHSGRTSLSVPENLGWVLVALVASLVTYLLVENPVRHARPLVRVRWASVALGVGITAVALGIVSLQAAVVGGTPSAPVRTASSAPRAASLQTVLKLVAASDSIRTVPPDLTPPLSFAVPAPRWNLGQPPARCVATINRSMVPACAFGDRVGTRTMVLYGDSHAAMWFQALDSIATRTGWRLIVLSKLGCLADPLPAPTPREATEWKACDQWHTFALARINRIDPNLLVVTQAITQTRLLADVYTPSQWHDGMTQLLRRVRAQATVVLGNIPDSGGPSCVAGHRDDVQACSRMPFTAYNNAERQAAIAEGARYVDVTPWFCAKRCNPIIGNYDVYFNSTHIAVRYTHFLERVLAQGLGLSG